MFKTMLIGAALLVSAASAPAGVLTGFDAGKEGWTGLSADITTSGVPVTNAGVAVNWSAASGHPGGAISVVDPDNFDTFFAAPAAFLGDQSAAFGTSLGYDLFTDQTPDYNGPNVVLEGGGLTLVHVPMAQAALLNQWVGITVPLGDDGLWRLGSVSGASAAASDIQTALGSLTALWISGDTHNGLQETSVLDNVRLGRVDATVPEPSSLLLASAALVLLRHRRRISRCPCRCA